MNSPKQMAISISFSMLPDDMAKVNELMELLDKSRSGIVQQAIRELHAKVAEQAVTGANNGHQPA